MYNSILISCYIPNQTWNSPIYVSQLSLKKGQFTLQDFSIAPEVLLSCGLVVVLVRAGAVSLAAHSHHHAHEVHHACKWATLHQKRSEKSFKVCTFTHETPRKAQTCDSIDWFKGIFTGTPDIPPENHSSFDFPNKTNPLSYDKLTSELRRANDIPHQAFHP